MANILVRIGHAGGVVPAVVCETVSEPPLLHPGKSASFGI